MGTLAPRFERYVALGDSSTEGLDDPDGRGAYRGWSRRLAARIAAAQGTLLYANLGVRGLTTRQIRDRQLEPALAMRPDLATVFSGTNDLTRRRFEPGALAGDMEAMQRALVAGGARVLTFTLPDLTPIMPLARWLAPRIRSLNEALRAAAARSGATLIDFAVYPVGVDPRLWSEDRIHANAAGHARIAAALAHALALPGSDDAWQRPLPPPAARSRWERLTGEVTWMRRHLLPWVGRGLGARASGEPGVPAPATLQPVESARATFPAPPAP
jgi:lysophospholipase L1-like esterase